MSRQPSGWNRRFKGWQRTAAGRLALASSPSTQSPAKSAGTSGKPSKRPRSRLKATVKAGPASKPKRSRPETQLADALRLANVEQWDEELRFHATRRWRFDFAWRVRRIAVEVEGGVWSGGRHTRGAGFVGDCEKYNAATLLGWSVLRFVPRSGWIGPAVEQIKEALA